MVTEGKMTLLDTRAVPPFGTDHVIALVTPLTPTALRQQLRVANGQRGAERLVAPIKSPLGQAGARGELSIGAFYTGAEACAAQLLRTAAMQIRQFAQDSCKH